MSAIPRRLIALAVVGALSASACSDDSGDAEAPTDDTVEPTADTTEPSDDAEASAPLIEADAVTVATTDFNNLSATVSLTTTVESSVTVRAESENGHIVETPATADGTSHEVTVLGLRPDTTYDITASARTSASVDEATTSFTSGPIPDHFPSLRVVASDPEAMAPGLTLVPLTTRANGWEGAPTRPGDAIEDTFLLIALDPSGEIVWYLEAGGRVSDFELTDRGTILYVEDQLRIVEITTTGEIVGRWEGRASVALREGAPAPDETVFVDTDTMHHEIAVLPDGNFLTLSTELIESGLDSLPCETEQGVDDGFVVISDIVVEFDPVTGEIVDEWPLAEILDPTTQPGAVLCDPVPFPTWYPDEPDAGDWTHANAVAIDTESDQLLVSVRHLNSVVALDYGDDPASRGDLLWQLGPDLDFELAGDDEAEWQYMQHAPTVRDDGAIVLYDNGNLRPGTELAGGDAPDYSRAAAYRLDAAAGTATQIWEHVAREEDGTPIYADFVGDADPLDNGNVLVAHGGILIGEFVFDEELGQEVIVARTKGRLLEVVPEGSLGGNVVFEVEIIDSRIGWFFFAAERVASLYPSG